MQANQWSGWSGVVMADLLELLEYLDTENNPTVSRPLVRDSTTDERVHRYDRCPDCGVMGWGRPYPQHPYQRRTFRTVEGWHTLGSCDCGRLRLWSLQRVEPSPMWLDRSPRQWGPIVPTPDTAAWLAGADRESVP